MKVAFLTLGCKVNQYEADSLENELEQNGFEIVQPKEVADFYVLSTCAVTNEAESKSRQMIAKVKKINENAKIIVCGCAVESDYEQFENKNVIFLGNANKHKIVDIIKNIETIKNNQVEKLTKTYEDNFESKATKTRAHLKIQDGCNNFCSYCLIPYVRGRSRSRNVESIRNEAIELAKKAKEIVLVGINLSDFKIDGELALDKLVLALQDVDCRFRFGSLEVNVITEKFLDILSVVQNFVPHFHLSMQSGCDKILKLMNRHYTKKQYLSKIELIRKYFPNASITTDVIVGFPTETDEDFIETVETIYKAQFFNMHIFPYSKRKGTVAEKLEQVDGNIVINRVKILEQINEQLNENFILQNYGKPLKVLIEEYKDGFSIGHSENYIKIYIQKN